MEQQQIVRLLSGRHEFVSGFSMWIKKAQPELVSVAEGDVL